MRVKNEKKCCTLTEQKQKETQKINSLIPIDMETTTFIHSTKTYYYDASSRKIKEFKQKGKEKKTNGSSLT